MWAVVRRKRLETTVQRWRVDPERSASFHTATKCPWEGRLRVGERYGAVMKQSDAGWVGIFGVSERIAGDLTLKLSKTLLGIIHTL
jgi:hypothetical protein